MPRQSMTFVFALIVLTALAVLCGVVLLAHPADAGAVTCTPSAISPENASTGQAFNVPIPLSVNVVVTYGPHVSIYWYSSPTGLAGTWTLRGSAVNVHNGTHSFNCTWNINYYTIYYWRIVYITQANHDKTSATTGAVYHFTTRDSTIISQGNASNINSILIFVFFLGIMLGVLGIVLALIPGKGKGRNR